MNTKFVPAAAAYRKLDYACSTNSSVYIFGATGYGKTRLVQEYLEGRSSLWCSPLDENWNASEIEARIKENGVEFVVIDDLQWIREADERQVVCDLARRNDIELILIGRILTPQWLLPLIADGYLIVVSEENLQLTVREVREIARNEQVDMTDEVLEQTVQNSEGNAYIISATINMLKAGNPYNDSLIEMMGRAFSDHLETKIIPQWGAALQDFLMKVSVVDEFTLELAVMITGDDRAALMLDEALTTGNFLSSDHNMYRLRPYLVRALRKRALEVFGFQKYMRCVNHAGLYYEIHNDVMMALQLCEKSGNEDGIRTLLIRNGRRHFGVGHFYELRHYYLSLDERDVETSPVLMNVLSMLYSVLMNSEQSEYWYQKLKAFEKRAGGVEKKEANELLLYLDLALPHRTAADMIDVIKRAAVLLKTGNLKLPEFSVTNNQPSVMNGGKDFCSWSKNDRFLADTIGKPLEKLLGNSGRGLIHAALCESLFEKGGQDAEAAHHAMLVQMETEGGGKTEILFAAIGIQVRLGLIAGSPKNAIQLLDSFEERIKRENKSEMMPCLRAFRCRLALVLGEKEIADIWIREAPDELTDFCTLERYRYMTKALWYLQYGKNQEAIDLLQRLRYYADVNRRPYIRMEAGILMAIGLRREKQEWKELLVNTLNEIMEYRFVRIITQKGKGILPLLKEVKKEYLEDGTVDRNWFMKVLKEAESVAERYPGYLNCDVVQPSDFSDIALMILKMQASGVSIREIAAELGLSERTVKYHAAENYRKLGAKGKTDAVQIAGQLNLL